MIPLYGILEGDTLGLLIFAYPEDKISELAQKLAGAASLRAAGGANRFVWRKGELIDSGLTVGQVGFQPLELFRVTSEPNL